MSVSCVVKRSQRSSEEDSERERMGGDTRWFQTTTHTKLDYIYLYKYIIHIELAYTDTKWKKKLHKHTCKSTHTHSHQYKNTHHRIWREYFVFDPRETHSLSVWPILHTKYPNHILINTFKGQQYKITAQPSLPPLCTRHPYPDKQKHKHYITFWMKKNWK